MFVFVEGIDRTGKSELANELVHELGLGLATGRRRVARVVHYGAPQRETALEEYVQPFLDYDGSEDIVLDRAHVGEAVWPKYFGRESRMTPAERQLIELFYLSIGAVGVLTRRPDDQVREAFAAADPPEPLPVDDVLLAKADFEREWEHVLVPRIRYDHSPNSRDEGRKLIVDTALKNDLCCTLSTDWSGAVRQAVERAL